MKQEDIISMAREAAQAPDRTDKSVLFFGLNGEQMFRFAELVADVEAKRMQDEGMVTIGHMREKIAAAVVAEREAIYKMVLLDTLKDPDLLMPESEVDDNDADDYFKSSDFRYAMNNAVKFTIFTITANIRARKNDVA